jgi:hypothetical protein
MRDETTHSPRFAYNLGAMRPRRAAPAPSRKKPSYRCPGNMGCSTGRTRHARTGRHGARCTSAPTGFFTSSSGNCSKERSRKNNHAHAFDDSHRSGWSQYPRTIPCRYRGRRRDGGSQAVTEGCDKSTHLFPKGTADSISPSPRVEDQSEGAYRGTITDRFSSRAVPGSPTP